MAGNWPIARANWPLLEDTEMRITPLDVRKQEFKRGMRGYDNDEVRAFLSTLADEYEAVLVDNKQLRERVLEQDEKLGEYRNLEKTLRDTLMTAERVTQDAKETARREGEVLLEKAQQRVEQVLAEGRERLNDLRREALAVHREKEAYLGRFRSLAEAQIHFVEQHHSDFVELDGRLLEQADALPTKQTRAPEATSAPALPEFEESRPSAPAAAVEYGPDEWRDYAIKTEEEAAATEQTAKPEQASAVAPIVTGNPAGEVEAVVDVVQQAEQSIQQRDQQPAMPQAATAEDPQRT
jgi:cell division initiation protein